MKTKIFSVLVCLMATITVQAQQIAVVTKDGATTLHRTLEAAITAATANSVIYLPGGGFPISDDVKITKKLTIIGIGHKGKGENADGYTTITGNLYFDKESNGSALMGVYMTGTVYIGNDGNEVDDILVRYCNINEVRVQNSKCLGTVVNQNYIRNNSYFNGAGGDFSNCVAYGIRGVSGGTIANNILVRTGGGSTGDFAAICECTNCSIINNVFKCSYTTSDSYYSGNIVFGNSALGGYYISNDQKDLNYFLEGFGLGDVYEKDLGVSPNSVFHFKDDYKQYEGYVGIYGGTGFSDGQLPPAPFIVEKSIPEQTDASGNLNIRIRVKAGE